MHNLRSQTYRCLQDLWLSEPPRWPYPSHSEGTQVAALYSFEERAPLRNRHRQGHDSKKSAQYLPYAKGSAVAVDALAALASAAGMFWRIMLALVNAVPSKHHHVPRPGIEAGSHSQRSDT